MTSPFNFAILLYVSRSGSTYLGRLLAENCKDLAVIPESNYFRILIAHQKLVGKIESNQIAKLLLEDPKFQGFQISKGELVEILQKCTTHKEAILAITNRILKGRGSADFKAVLIKDGGLVDFIPEIISQFENSKIIHIHRDPRACINSLLHSPKAFLKGKSSMGWDDIELCAKQYKAYIGKIQSLKSQQVNIFSLGYENLLENNDEGVHSVLEYLNLNPSAEDKRKTENYLRKEESRIHQNIYREAQQDRATAWQQELKSWERNYIEFKLKEFLPENLTKSNKRHLFSSLFKAKKNHVLGLYKLNLYRINRYLLKGNWDLFRLKLRMRFAD